MSDLGRVFSRKAFIAFVTAGDPDIETTERIIPEMADAGADLIEIGIPFSDPIAEGPVIQAADIRALSNGVTTDAIFDMVERIRAGGCDVPLAVMTYMNPVFVYGPDRFMECCARAGICAVIVPDVPYEEKGELLPACRAHGVRLISMIAPTSEERISMIASEAEGEGESLVLGSAWAQPARATVRARAPNRAPIRLCNKIEHSILLRSGGPGRGTGERCCNVVIIIAHAPPGNKDKIVTNNQETLQPSSSSRASS